MPLEYTFTCLGCAATYKAKRSAKVVGPIHDEIVTGQMSSGHDGISFIETEAAYTGRIENVSCPYCLYSIVIASELPSEELRRAAEDVLKSGEVEAFFTDENHEFRLARPPFRCPVCTRTIESYNERKRCRECGEADLQVSKPTWSADGK